MTGVGGTGQLVFTLPGDVSETVIDLGVVTKITDTVQKKVMLTPIVSLDMQSAFPIETGNSQSYSISFSRKNPPVVNDDSLDVNDWSNSKWYRWMTKAIDRWQARTNGCILKYTPKSDNIYQGDIISEVGGYVKSIGRTYDVSYNEVISGTLTFVVGTMYVNGIDPEVGRNEYTENYTSQYILISDSEEINWYPLHYGDVTSVNEEYDCIDSMTIKGGVEDPFETAQITIPKKKLMEQIPALYGDIVDGKNKILIHCMGTHTMYLEQAKTSGSNFILNACTYAQRYQQSVIDADITGNPLNIITGILEDPKYGFFYKGSNRFITNILETDALNDVRITIPKNTIVWRALQICATMLRARMFFADDRAYLIDYTRQVSDTYTRWVETVDPDDRDAIGGYQFYRRMVSTGEIDPEGLAPVKNSVVISYTPDPEDTEDDGQDEFHDPDDLSFDKYGSLAKGNIRVPELVGNNQARTFAQNHLIYIREPQRSITFTIKEMYGASGSPSKIWQSFFGASAQVGTIYDRVNTDVVRNSSTLHNGPAYQKLCLSSYKRSFPKGTCEYTFGTVANVDLSNYASQVTNTLNV